MLRKLMKQEILASSRNYLPVLVAIVVMTGMSIISFRVEDQSISLGLVFLCLTMLIMGAAGGLTIYNLIVSMGTRIYGKPGYLLFSVPAKTWEIMLSKILINLMWLILTSVICLGSAAFMFQVVYQLVGENPWEIFSFLLSGYDFWDYFQFGTMGLVGLIYQISFFMFLFALLNLVYKGEKKIIMGILLYFGLTWVIGLLQNVVFGGTFLVYFEGQLQPESFSAVYWGNMILESLLTVLFLGLTYHFMDKKMELQ